MKQKGFTLIEMLVVIAMIGIISTISVANYRKGEKSRRAGIAQDSVLTALTTAQGLALSGKKTNNANASCRIPKLYFVDFVLNQNTATIKVLNNCDTIDSVDTLKIPDGTTVSQLSMNGANANTNMAIGFDLPFVKVFGLKDVTTPVLANFATYTNPATVTIVTSDGSISKIVTVDPVSGRISNQ